MMAMHQAIGVVDRSGFAEEGSVSSIVEFVLVDGNYFESYGRQGENFLDFETVPHKCIIKGDDKFASIAAASVIAKVERDKFMTVLAEKYPDYSWETNAGYGTKAHIEGIKKAGITKWHRKTFLTGILSKPTQLL